MRRVLWSGKAADEYEGIIGYIAERNPIAAANVARRVRDAIDLLAAVPIGRSGRVAGTYEKPISGLPYIIVYALEPSAAGEGNLVVLRIIHGARDWPEGEWPRD